VGTYTRRYSFLHLAPGQILVVAVLATLAVPVAPTSTLHWTGRLVFAIVVTAIFATAFAFGTQVWAQQYTPPAHTALIFALEPVFAALTSRVVTREHMGGKVLWREWLFPKCGAGQGLPPSKARVVHHHYRAHRVEKSDWWCIL
jgi:drug/metabolite transporter (DMT)-like permease